MWGHIASTFSASFANNEAVCCLYECTAVIITLSYFHTYNCQCLFKTVGTVFVLFLSSSFTDDEKINTNNKSKYFCYQQKATALMRIRLSSLHSKLSLPLFMIIIARSSRKSHSTSLLLSWKILGLGLLAHQLIRNFPYYISTQHFKRKHLGEEL